MTETMASKVDELESAIDAAIQEWRDESTPDIVPEQERFVVSAGTVQALLQFIDQQHGTKHFDRFFSEHSDPTQAALKIFLLARMKADLAPIILLLRRWRQRGDIKLTLLCETAAPGEGTTIDMGRKKKPLHITATALAENFDVGLDYALPH